MLIRVARVYGENLRRIAQAEPGFCHDHVEEPLLASGMSEPQMRETATQMSDRLAGAVQRMLLAIYTRHQKRYTIDHLSSTSRRWSPNGGRSGRRPCASSTWPATPG